MDRNYYYRILGLRNDATPAQINKAYRARIARLNSADYADDAEYVRKKKMQAKHAYEVLTGASAPCSDRVKERRFERFKDSIEAREGLDHDDFFDDGTSERHVKRQRRADSMSMELDSFADSVGSKIADVFGKLKPKGRGTSRKARQTSFGTSKSGSKKITIGVLVSVFSVIIGISSLIGMFIGDAIDPLPDFDLDSEYVQATIEDIDEARLLYDDYDFYANLDLSTMQTNAANIDWDEGVGDYGDSAVEEYLLDALGWHDIYGQDTFFYHVTGEEDFYYDEDDYDCAVAYINWVGAPSFEAVAGATNNYDGTVILSMADYMAYLEDIAYDMWSSGYTY